VTDQISIRSNLAYLQYNYCKIAMNLPLCPQQNQNHFELKSAVMKDNNKETKSLSLNVNVCKS